MREPERTGSCCAVLRRFGANSMGAWLMSPEGCALRYRQAMTDSLDNQAIADE
jgi:hypothetical protein